MLSFVLLLRRRRSTTRRSVGTADPVFAVAEPASSLGPHDLPTPRLLLLLLPRILRRRRSRRELRLRSTPHLFLCLCTFATAIAAALLLARCCVAYRRRVCCCCCRSSTDDDAPVATSGPDTPFFCRFARFASPIAAALLLQRRRSSVRLRLHAKSPQGPLLTLGVGTTLPRSRCCCRFPRRRIQTVPVTFTDPRYGYGVGSSAAAISAVAASGVAASVLSAAAAARCCYAVPSLTSVRHHRRSRTQGS